MTMLRNTLVVVGFNLPWDWSTDYCYQTARILSKRGNLVVCYMLGEAKSLKELLIQKQFPRVWEKHRSNLYKFRPLYLIPFRRLHFISKLNDRLNVYILKIIANYLYKEQNLLRKILWVFDPQFYDIYRLFGRNYLLLYDCVDYFRGSTGSKHKARYIKHQETKLLQTADMVTAISYTLAKIHSKNRKNISVVPQGFRREIFQNRNFNVTFKIPREKPIIGYIGAINFRLDFNLIRSLAIRNPAYQFLLVGPIHKDNEEEFGVNVEFELTQLFKYRNISYYPTQPKTIIPDIIDQFNIAIIPYDQRLKFNRYAYPMKLFEYFYLGKPVISTPIEELERFPKFVKIGKNVKEWEKIIKELLSKPWPKTYKKEQKMLAIKTSWENKIEKISSFL